MTIRLEAGKSYRTRDGRKVTVVRISSGMAINEDGRGIADASNGKYYFTPHESPNDLIAEWTDDVPALVYKEGDIVHVKGVIVANPYDSGKPTAVKFGEVNATPNIDNVEIVHHEPAPLKVGEYVTWNEFRAKLVGIHEGIAWLVSANKSDKLVPLNEIKRAPADE